MPRGFTPSSLSVASGFCAWFVCKWQPREKDCIHFCSFLLLLCPLQPIYCSAFLKFSSKKIKEGEFLGIVVLCKLASVMKIRELCVGAFFKTKHALDLSYTAVDTRSAPSREWTWSPWQCTMPPKLDISYMI